MKAQTILRTFSISLLFVVMGSVAMAQTIDEKKAREAEMKVKQEQLELQRKQMKEQQLKTRQLEQVYAEQARAASRGSSARFYSNSTGIGEPSYFIYSGGQENQSQLTIRNSFDGETDSAEGEFDVNESTTHIRCTINGKARTGRINIEVLYPGGKVFKDLSITSSAEISFTQSMSIQEDEKKKYVGAWKYRVTAEKAEGSYTLSFITH